MGFQDILRHILPSELGFRKIDIRIPDVTHECDAGDFPLEGASGGVSALINLAWLIFMKSRTSEGFVVVIDEPENHLHPRLQRTVLPGLLDAFPNAQFIVAAHNPFVVTSVEDSTIVVLDFVHNKVESQALPEQIALPRPTRCCPRSLEYLCLPLWVERKLENLVAEYSDKDLDKGQLDQLRAEMHQLGLGHYFPETIRQIVEPENSDSAD